LLAMPAENFGILILSLLLLTGCGVSQSSQSNQSTTNPQGPAGPMGPRFFYLKGMCRKTAERAAWLDHLPDVLRRLEDLSALTPDAPLDGEEPSCPYLAGVRSADGTPTVR